MIDRTEIADRIRELRCQARYSQKAVAEMLFISQPAYSLIESGHNSVAIDHIIRLSRIYGKSTDFLILGKKAEVRNMILSHESSF